MRWTPVLSSSKASMPLTVRPSLSVSSQLVKAGAMSLLGSRMAVSSSVGVSCEILVRSGPTLPPRFSMEWQVRPARSVGMVKDPPTGGRIALAFEHGGPRLGRPPDARGHARRGSALRRRTLDGRAAASLEEELFAELARGVICCRRPLAESRVNLLGARCARNARAGLRSHGGRGAARGVSRRTASGSGEPAERVRPAMASARNSGPPEGSVAIWRSVACEALVAAGPRGCGAASLS